MTNRIKVMVLIKGLGLGGAEKLLELGIPHLDRDRFQYEVGYLLPWKNALVSEFQKADIPVFCLDQRKPYDFRVIPKLARLLRRRQIDLLHLHLPYSGVVGRVASRLSPVKAVVYTEHNVWRRYHRLTTYANRLTYSWNDAVLAVSKEVERSIPTQDKTAGHPILTTIPNGVDVDQLASVIRDPQGVKEEFSIPINHKLVVQVASFTPKKRHTDLLRAAKGVLEQDPHVTFMLVGQGPLEADVRAEAFRLGIEDRVVFTGLRADATRLIAAADLFVLSSLYEGLPVSLLEAMALGTPVIATRVGGISEAITDGIEGILVDPLDPSQLERKILSVLGDGALQRCCAINGTIAVRERFDVRNMVLATERIYEKALAMKGER